MTSWDLFEFKLEANVTGLEIDITRFLYCRNERCKVCEIGLSVKIVKGR